MELVTDVRYHLGYRTAVDFAGLDFPGAAVNDFLPLGFRVGIHGVVEAGDELAGQIRPVLLGQSQHFSNFFSGHAHTRIVSPKPVD